ncbi:hypothetical protein AK830_g10478 [Neonectria ditissima]|uniref:PLD phosphodiesterase domain-containing protein n=1 Tax=Neonectria ditissima TaxID=78410 RepID=A0A0P7APX4_9HYPO|nr:hypothetical protein AK830_g10478 [Neonectria ditissima]
MDGAHADIPDFGADMNDDEALRYAIALSLQEEPRNQPAEQKPPRSSPSNRNEVRSGEPTLGLLALDRKKMEEERLQRLAKRRRSASSDDDVVEVPPPKRKTLSEPSKSPSLPPFANGTVKRTWARGYPRTPDDIKIEEVLQKDSLLLAVLSSYQWDDEWILSKVDLRKTKLLLLAFAADDTQMVFLVDLPRLANSVGHQPTTFSTELGRFLKATGVDEGMVSSLSNYDFSRTQHLRFVYTMYVCPASYVKAPARADVGVIVQPWRASKRGTEASRPSSQGYCGLGASVASLGLANSDPVEVDLVCASLGAINRDLIGAMYNACRGDDGMTEYNSRLSRATKAKAASAAQPFKEHFRIYFPTDETVAQSRGGRRNANMRNALQAAGTICVQAKWWRAPTFPTELVRDCVNTRDGLLMHSKMIFVRNSRTRGGQTPTAAAAATEAADAEADPGQSSPGWAYIGSANLSESAWGRLVKDRATGKPKMSCRNWECGVVIRVPGSSKAQAGAGKDDFSNMGIFKGTVPVPMRFPGRRYRESEEPWFYA